MTRPPALLRERAPTIRKDDDMKFLRVKPEAGMNIIIVGCGKVGYALAKQLSMENHDITIIDNSSKVIEKAQETLDVMVMSGNGAALDIQREARVDEADLLIAATPSDELNLLTCLIARKSGNCSTIARVRNPEYGKEVQLFK